MPRPQTLVRWLGLGLVAEILVFAAVADRIGVGPAILIGLLFSLLGAAMLRRSGMSAAAALRGLAGEAGGREGAFIDGVLSAVGALLLILPGFLTDALGLLLLAPSGRQFVAQRLGLGTALPAGRPRRETGGRTIDLDSRDFSRLDNARSR